MDFMGELTDRWTPLKYHEIQYRLWTDTKRFKVVAAGRRSGKTELAKRSLVLNALFCQRQRGWFVAAAPTRPQAKEIFWDELKALVHPSWRRKDDSETDLSIYLINGSDISVRGLDKPQRLEGRPLDQIVIDEIDDTKADSWDNHIRPSLDTIGRLGVAWLIGVPNGRGQLFKHSKKALGNDDWEFYKWISADILPKEYIDAARSEMDELSFKQEYEASFVVFEGLVYYCYNPDLHIRNDIDYNENKALIFAFDFNVDPGVAVIMQELPLKNNKGNIELCTSVIGEVHIPRNSTTPAVCRKLIQDWVHHDGSIFIYGDATGGARSTRDIIGSDWDIIKEYFKQVPNWNTHYMYSNRNPAERVRVNTVNSRLKNTNGDVKFYINEADAPNVVKDFEGVTVLEGGSGEIDKKANPELTHLSDAIGYYLTEKYSISSGNSSTTLF